MEEQEQIIVATDEAGQPSYEIFYSANLSMLPLIGDTWMLEDGYILSALNLLNNTSVAELSSMREHAEEMAKTSAEKQRKNYQVRDGIAYIPMMGLMTKRPTSMGEFFGGGCSTLIVQEAIRASLSDEAVKRIVLWIESPGGDVNGTFDLANFVARANKHKPVDVYAPDIIASAAYCVGSQARTIFANDNCIAGSIGVYTKLIDSSEAAKQRGVQVHVIKAGKYKAIGEAGVPISKEEIDKTQQRVNSLQSLFVKAVSRGRNMSAEQLTKVADGSVFVGQEAVKVHLIDGITDMDTFHEAIVDNRKLKGVNMAVEIEDVRTWLSDNSDVTSPVDVPPIFAIQQPGPVTPPVVATEPTIDAGVNTILAANGITRPDQVTDLINRAKVGDTYIARLRDQTKSLAIVALGAEDGAEAASVIDNLSVDGMRAMAKQYEAIAVKQGLIEKVTPKRKTIPSAVAAVTEDDTDETKPTDEEQAQANRDALMDTGLYGF